MKKLKELFKKNRKEEPEKYKKIKGVKIGVPSLGKAADRLKILDKCLRLFGMAIGVQDITLDATPTGINSVRLTVYFFDKPLKEKDYSSS